MQEAFLHYLWQLQYFDKKALTTTQGESLTILRPGMPNAHGGPDFLNASVVINGIIWHGHVELHVHASDWYKHQHQKDVAYENVILHAVWEYDQPIQQKDKTAIPTLSLKRRAHPGLYKKYEQLIQSPSTIACASLFDQATPIAKTNMLEKVLFQRLMNKQGLVYQLLKNNKGDWEATAHQLLAHSLGLKANSQAFLELAKDLPLSLLVKYADRLPQLEALLFGRAGWLSDTQKEDDYRRSLGQNYQYICHKHTLPLTKLARTHWQFARLRPSNFPTVRLAQWAALLHQHHGHLMELIHWPITKLYKELTVIPSPYWQTHYQFAKPTANRTKPISKRRIDLLIINAIVPLLVAYGQLQDEQDCVDKAVGLLQALPPERNARLALWKQLGLQASNAYDSQAMLELLNSFCMTKKCLSCTIGVELIQKK